MKSSTAYIGKQKSTAYLKEDHVSALLSQQKFSELRRAVFVSKNTTKRMIRTEIC